MARSAADFGEFYLASYGRTVAVVAAIVGSRHEAEDIAQEAYARALSRWPRLRDYDLPDAWVRRVAVRIAIDSGRRRQRWQAVRERLALARHPDVLEPGDDLRYSPLGAALLDLPLGQRHVVVLHYLADLPVEVIARECGVPAGTVKTRLAAGRRRLEQLLSQQPEEIGK